MTAALVSGMAGEAVVLGPDRCWALSVDEPSPREVSTRQAGTLAMHPDAERVEAGEFPFAALAAELERRWACHRALQMVLIASDAVEDRELRCDAAEAGDELLADAAVLAHVRDRLLAQEPPAEADFPGALDLARRAGARRVAALLGDLERARPVIASARAAWRDVVRELDDPIARSAAVRLVDETGAVSRLVERALGDSASWAPWVLRVAAEWRQGLPQAARLLNDWARRVAPAERRVVEPDEGRRGAARASSRGSLELSPVEARASVERQVAGILDALRGGHRARAEGYLEDLRRFQAEEPAYLVQTLCRLAAETERTDPAWALERLEEAVQVAPDDAFAWSQLATAYRRRGRLDEALNASRKGVAFGSDSQVATQHAEVLKGLGRLDEALAAYEKIIERFPHEVVPLNGRAEVLKALGRLDEALAAYEQTAERFSPEVVPRNGRAEVLKALGRLDEALAAYEETVDLFRQEVVPRNGRADVLKALGRLDEALAVYEETVDLFPREVIPRNGRAEVLKALGRLGESLAAYEEAVDLFPQEVVPRNGRAEVLKALGRLHEALAAYEETIDRFPQDVVARTGRAGILLAMRRPAEARAIFNDVLRSWPDDSYARTGRAMAFLMERRWADAREALRLDAPPRTEGDWVLLRLSGIVELRVGNLDAAERILTHVVRETPWAKARESARQALELVRLRRNRAPQAEAGLRAMGRPADRTACCSWLLLLAAAVATQNRKREAAALVAEVQHDAAPEIVATRTALIRVFGLGSGPPDRAESENLFDAQVMLLAA